MTIWCNFFTFFNLYHGSEYQYLLNMLRPPCCEENDASNNFMPGHFSKKMLANVDIMSH